MSNDLPLQTYVDACADAARRSRTWLIVLTFASVLMLSSLVNSFQGSWKQRRAEGLAHIDSPSVRAKLGELPYQGSSEYEVYRNAHKELYAMALKQYWDSVYSIPIPIVGVNIDINHVGVFGGVTLLVLLFLFRIKLSRELENLEISFDLAGELREMNTFYYLLAMRQTLSSPRTQYSDEVSNAFQKLIRWICLLPVSIYVAQVTYDLYTVSYFTIEVVWVIYVLIESVVLVGITYFTYLSLLSWRKIDSLWDESWEVLVASGSSSNIQNYQRKRRWGSGQR